MAEALTSPEEAAVSSFLDWLKREEPCQNTNLISHVTAVKFLMARKFDVARAIELFQAYTNTRIKEGIYNINPNEEPLRSELLSGKFTVLPGRDFRGAALALFTARLHRPELSTHTSVLQAIIYQLDKAIDSVQTQRAGLVFIYDMTNSCYRNFDYDLCVKILNLLKGAFPARLKCVFIVSSPLWFRAPFAVLRLFVREKLRERVCAVRASHLTSLIPASSLPEHLGGSSQFSHISWIQSCTETSGEREQNLTTDARLAHGDLRCHHNGLCAGDRVTSVNERRQSLPQSDTPTHGEEPNAVFVNSIQTVGSVMECVDDRVGVPPLPLKSRVHPGAGQSVHGGGPGGMNVQELLQHVKNRRKKGIYQEYEEIRREPPAGTFHCSKKPSNQMKNRYSDVLCLDQSRVRLCPLGGDETSDYINASFMDGYKRTNAYIATQGPLPKTFGDFWRMVWEQMVLIIVMTTRVVERGRVKCGQYWPLEAGHSENYGYFLVKTVVVDAFQDFKLSHLQLVNTQTGECREVWHYLYISWPDFGVPRSAAAMLDFQAHVKRRRETLSLTLSPDWPGPAGGPPVVVHCSAGIGRTGTFCTLDICLCGLEDVGTVDVRQTVRNMRTQRAFSIQTWDQYYFCYRALLEFCRRSGRITAGHWSDSELDSDSD